MCYKKILETISKFENIENIKALINKPRLTIFKEINDKEDYLGVNDLLKDIKNINKDDIIERIDSYSL